jgi:hypothetical protein
MMKYLKNNRGDFGVPFIACYILAMVILMVMLMTWVSAEVTCLCIRNTVKNELTNVSIRISEDTYRAMREGNLTEYYHTLTDDAAYRSELESLVKNKIASAMPLQTETYKLDNITLTFAENGDNIEYILTCDVEYYVSLFGGNRTVREESIMLTGRHNLKAY